MGLCHIIGCSRNGPMSYNKAVLVMVLCDIIGCFRNGPMSYNRLFS